MKKILFVLFILFSFFVINNLVRSIYTSWRRKDLLVTASQQLEREKQENQRLKSQLTIVNSPEFIEKEARDKLFLVKPGEERVLLPGDSGLKNQSNNQEKIPNWKQWLQLFF